MDGARSQSQGCEPRRRGHVHRHNHRQRSNFGRPRFTPATDVNSVESIHEVKRADKVESPTVTRGGVVLADKSESTSQTSAPQVQAACTDSILALREVGDLVRVHGRGTPADYRGKVGIVTEVHEKHCTVTILSDDLHWGLGQVWPNYQDTELLDKRLRLGSRVVLQGLRASDAVLNGKGGQVIASKYGHPAFMQKGIGARLCVCVKLNEKVVDRPSSLIVQPWHLALDEGDKSNLCADFCTVLTSLQEIAATLSVAPAEVRASTKV